MHDFDVQKLSIAVHRFLQDSRDDESSANNVYDALVILFAMSGLTFIVWLPLIFQRCRPNEAFNQRFGPGTITNATDTHDEADGALDSLGQPLRNLLRRLSVEDRREYINNVLMTQVVKKERTHEGGHTSGASNKNGQSTESCAIRVFRPDSHLSLPEGAEREDDHKLASAKIEPCPICLVPYMEGDEVCWSHNKRCPHYFHRECISEWLLKHVECPCCRCNYLVVPDDKEVACSIDVELGTLHTSDNDNDQQQLGNPTHENDDGSGNSTSHRGTQSTYQEESSAESDSSPDATTQASNDRTIPRSAL